jgi:drug/metabolite transporter (DMT)-like permease
MDAGQRRAVLAALGAALLFGASTPAAKVLLGDTSPLLLAGLLYLGSGTGLAIYRVLARVPRISMSRPDALWLAGAILAGGIAGPALLMAGLARMPASEASLLLNGEGVFTALIAWFVFRENVASGWQSACCSSWLAARRFRGPRQGAAATRWALSWSWPHASHGASTTTSHARSR